MPDLFFAENLTTTSTELLLSQEESRHIKKSLRKQQGDEILLTNGQGLSATAKIISETRTQLICKPLKIDEHPQPLRLRRRARGPQPHRRHRRRRPHLRRRERRLGRQQRLGPLRRLRPGSRLLNLRGPTRICRQPFRHARSRTLRQTMCRRPLSRRAINCRDAVLLRRPPSRRRGLKCLEYPQGHLLAQRVS